MRDIIQTIISAGILAPSGDNSQPWSFEVSENTIRVLAIPERDQSLYNWGNRAVYIAHGAALENMSIAAESLGYSLAINEFPEPQNPLLTAIITVQPGARKENKLANAIPLRCSNRKPYKKSSLLSSHKAEILQAGGANSILIEDIRRREIVASAIAQNEKVLFENKQMHAFFFDHMLWSAHDAQSNPLGFPVGALELPPPIRALWPLFRRWPVMSAITSIGFANLITLGNTPIYASGSALVCFTIADRSAKEFLRIGRVLERVWLTATHLGLSAQILTGIPLLMNGVLAGTLGLSPTHEQLVQKNYSIITDTVGTGATVAFFLRIGEATPPSARTPRLAIVLP